MTRWFLIFCAFLVVGAAIFQLVAKDGGYLLIVWGNTSIEMSLWFALICILIFVGVFWFIKSLLKGSVRGMATTKQRLFGQGNDRAQQKTVEGLIDFIEGNWLLALKKLTRSASSVKAPVINYLAAARSAYELGREEEALSLLHKAEQSDEKGRLVAAITQARMQFSNKEYEQALATLERASAIKADHPVVLSLREQVYVALKDWTALKALLPQLKNNNIGSAEERAELERKLYQEQLEELITNRAHQPEKIQQESLHQFWNAVPANIQQQQPLLTRYVGQLMAMGEHAAAEKILAKQIPGKWHGQWLDLYGLLLCEDSKKPLQTAEKWLDKLPDSSHLLLALGRLCLQNQQWGRAVDFLEKSLSLQPRAETYAELAKVLGQLGDQEKSQQYYKKGLLAATRTLAVYSNTSI